MAWFTITATAQSTWQWTRTEADMQSQVTDVYEAGDRYILSISTYADPYADPPARSSVVTLDANGSFVSSTPVLPDADHASVAFVGARQAGGAIHLSGACMLGDVPGFFASTITAQGELSEPVIWSFPGATWSMTLNSLPTADGGLLISGMLREPPGMSRSRVALVKIGADGAFERDAVFNRIAGQSVCWQVVEWNGAPWVLIQGRPGGTEVPNNSAVRLNAELGVDGWIQYPGLDLQPQVHLNNMLRDALNILPISNTRYIGAGRSEAPTNPPVVLVSDSTREVYRHFWPRSTYTMDITAFAQTLAAAPDGNVLCAVHEHFQLGLRPPWTPSEPNLIHVYKLDTSLNVLCEYILDGFEDNTNYILNRIKATADGGFILLGARRNMDDPSGYFEAWAQKFTTECFVGMAEEPLVQQAVLYPNPGREGFTFLLNGHAWNGTLALYDATGRMAGSAPIRAGQARFDAHGLASGVYAYRALGTDGRVLDTGRWMKE